MARLILGKGSRVQGWWVLPMLLGAALVAGCHVERERNPAGPGADTSQAIKFENVTTNIPVLVRIPDANQEFELAVNETRTVEVYSASATDIFFVEIIQNRPGQDLSVAPRWTGFVQAGKVVTIRQRITIQPEVHD